MVEGVFIVLLAAESGAEGGALSEWLPTIARWFNLLLFVGILYYLLRGPVRNALKTRREGIRRDLMRAQEERNAAVAKLEEVEARLTKLNGEVAVIRDQSEREAQVERERLARATEEESRKLREQAQREIDNAGKVARHNLRRFAAEQSVALAEEIIRRNIRPDDDTRLVQNYVSELGGTKR